MSVDFIIPKNYSTPLDIRQTERAIKLVKDTFENNLAKELNLERVSAPLFVSRDSGLNDNLNGTERPVNFDMLDLKNKEFEIVHSLAKWKRMALYRYGFEVGHGLYTDMNAIRRDEELDNLHSAYVDQWDWEQVITDKDRTPAYLHSVVRKIVSALKKTELVVTKEFTSLKPFIVDDVYFVTSQELEDMYPNLTPKEREHAIAKEKKTVFIEQIGMKLKSGNKHDGRAPDYDDWSLNGDILLYNPILERSFEISSMGIRVNKESLTKQLEISGCEDRRELPFHKMLLEDKLPLTIGGGIGQSRLCMLILQKAHVGEVQASAWSEEMIEECRKNNIILL
ncbi:MAG: aspartate--ammonia ligase [Ruminococcaceae bacterium]|nr:aspartate--ammonia ligase [Oscillospiraceae bacterium]